MSMRWLTLVAAMVVLVGACGAGPDPNGDKVASLGEPTNATEQPAADNRTDEDKMRDFVRCMRDHGVAVTEAEQVNPGGGSGGGGIAIEAGPGEEENVKKAHEECAPLLPNGGKPPKLDAAQLDQLREQAKCLRENGLNVPDPDPNNPGIRIEDADPEVSEKAFKACEHLAGGDFRVESRSGGPR
jgi:hypothetical protein